jgi:hypothetical protein
VFGIRPLRFARPGRGAIRTAFTLPATVALIIGSTAVASAQRTTAHTTAPHAATACVNNVAAGYPCNNVDLESHLPLSAIGGGDGSGGWGWTDTL